MTIEEKIKSLDREALARFLSESDFCDMVCGERECSNEYQENLQDTCFQRVLAFLGEEAAE